MSYLPPTIWILKQYFVRTSKSCCKSCQKRWIILNVRTSNVFPSACCQTAAWAREANSYWTALWLVLKYHFTSPLSLFVKQYVKFWFRWNLSTILAKGWLMSREDIVHLEAPASISLDLISILWKTFLPCFVCLILFSRMQQKWDFVHCDRAVSYSVTAFQRTDPLFFLTALLYLVLYLQS